MALPSVLFAKQNLDFFHLKAMRQCGRCSVKVIATLICLFSIDCRKYVCQKNCGVETFDQKRNEPIFLCKICSEYREVVSIKNIISIIVVAFKIWKKSG